MYKVQTCKSFDEKKPSEGFIEIYRVMIDMGSLFILGYLAAAFAGLFLASFLISYMASASLDYWDFYLSGSLPALLVAIYAVTTWHIVWTKCGFGAILAGFWNDMPVFKAPPPRRVGEDEPSYNAAVNLLFGKSLCIYGDPDPAVLIHEEGHLRQGIAAQALRYILQVLVVWALLGLFYSAFVHAFFIDQPHIVSWALSHLATQVLILVVSVSLLRFYEWGLEREADFYAYEKVGEKYLALFKSRRPNSRYKRLRAWLTDSHAPSWVRASREYYNRRVTLLRIFLRDVLK